MKFIHGKDLCRSFFEEIAAPILKENFPDLKYSAGLLGYGSDVLGYDDNTSTDHMWGPRFYLFLDTKDMILKEQIYQKFCEKFPYNYKGFSVNFSEPDLEDGGVQKSEIITSGLVRPLVWIQTLEEFINAELGISLENDITALDWLTFSEHRLLSLVKADWYDDALNLRKQLERFSYYPQNVWYYLIASNWSLLAEEQAFCRRCGDVGDEIGSRLVASRIAERIMNLCFLYSRQYSPYSKWFGTAFDRLNIPNQIKQEIALALSSNDLGERELALINAERAVIQLHNSLGILGTVSDKVDYYFSRKILTIHPDQVAGQIHQFLKETELENVPMIGTLSEVQNFTVISNHAEYREKIKYLYN